MPKGKGAKLSEAQLKALAAGRVAASAALAAANKKRRDEALAKIQAKQAAVVQKIVKAVPKNLRHLIMPKPITVDMQTGNVVKEKKMPGNIIKRNPTEIPLKEWLEEAKKVVRELGREAIENERRWVYLGDYLYQDYHGVTMVLNAVLPTAKKEDVIGLFPKNALEKIAKALGAKILGEKSELGRLIEVEPPFDPVWEE